MIVCDCRLMAIESREGEQSAKRVRFDDPNLNDDGLVTCEWCEEEMEYSECFEI